MKAAVAKNAENKVGKARASGTFDSEPAPLLPSGGAPAGLPRFLRQGALGTGVQFKCATCGERDEEPFRRSSGLFMQAKCADCGGELGSHDAQPAASVVHSIAREGIAGASRPLPHLDRIQASFGSRDLSGTRTAVGGAARRANDSMGSLAYAAGGRIAFRHEPDVKLAAHEAAHVVQQRAGVQLKDGVGRAGDGYERHADAVAEAVERGDSAAPLLDAFTPVAAAGRPALQHLFGSDTTTPSGSSVPGQSYAGQPPLAALAPGAPSDDQPATIAGKILSALDNRFVGAVAGAAFPTMAVALRGAVAVFRVAQDIYQNPDHYVAQVKLALGGMAAKTDGQAMAAATAAAPAGTFDCIWRHLSLKLAYLRSNWWEVLSGMAGDFLWPWPGFAQDFGTAGRLLAAAWGNLTGGRFNAAADDVMAALRYVNSAIGRLYGWFLILSVGVGAIAGAFFGSAPGAGAGAAAGLAFAGEVGQGLVIATAIIEGASLAKAAINLALPDRSDADKECDCEVVASSAFTLGILGAFTLLGAIAGRLARAIIQRFGRRMWVLPWKRGAGRVSSRTRRLAERGGEQLPENPRTRGDVAEARVTLAEQVRNVFSRRRVVVTDAFSTADNLPGIDFTVDSQIQLQNQTSGTALQELVDFDNALANGDRVQVSVNGGRVFQVKSHVPGPALRATINREINALSIFNNGQIGRVSVVVAGPAERVLVVFLREPLPSADLATLQANAAAAGVTFQPVVGGFPPGHPAVIPCEQLPSILGQLGQGGARAPASGNGSRQQGGPLSVVCDIVHPEKVAAE
jgi:hypothetical protein